MILAATAGHVGVVEILLDKGGDIEAQSERTKDTPLSLACSGGRQEVQTYLSLMNLIFFVVVISMYKLFVCFYFGGIVNLFFLKAFFLIE